MKQFYVYLLWLVVLTACENTSLTEPNSVPSPISKHPTQDGMQRVIVNSPDQIADLINQLGDPSSHQSRSVESSNVEFSNNEDQFVSLLEADRRRVLDSLNPEQLAEVEKLELEYEPSDSVIADVQFAMLLNANREIQVGNTIYKYYPNGVAQVTESHQSELQNIDNKTATLIVTPENEGQTINIDNHATFTFINYALHKDICDDEQTYGNGGAISGGADSNADWNPGDNPLILRDGRVVPESCVRVIDYNTMNDGGWFHQFWTGIFGKNVVAINHFSGHKKLTMHFYDQNYLIYSKIGTSLKMQEKKFGIWWNVSADELIQGWETVTLEYELPKPIPPSTFTHPDIANPTITTWSPFPFRNERTLLFHIPIIDYDLTTRDLNRAFKTAATKAFNAASAWSKLSVKSSDEIGLMCEKDRYAYIIHGPYEKNAYKRGSIESKFYAKWFPGEYQLHFSFGSSVKLKKVTFDPNDHVKLYRGSVYGAILYKGQWKAARIIKNY